VIITKYIGEYKKLPRKNIESNKKGVAVNTIVKRNFLALLFISMSVLVSYAQTEDQLNQNEAFLFGSIIDPFTIQSINYNSDLSIYDIYIGLKYEVLLGPKIAEFKDHSTLYFVGSPYLVATSGTIDIYTTEVGVQAGLIYFGKPLMLGFEVPFYWFGNEGTTLYEQSIKDLLVFRGIIGLNAKYKVRTIFGKEKIHRVYGGLSILHYPYGKYANYNSINIFIGRSY
jgi:hypothetical protein